MTMSQPIGADLTEKFTTKKSPLSYGFVAVLEIRKITDLSINLPLNIAPLVTALSLYVFILA
jgi:hypothetical protein